MNLGGLSLDQTPPLSVPAPYFVTAPLFLVAAGLLLVLHPEALQNRWTPAALALTHLVTLGLLGLVMLGALQQLLPVLAGAPVPAARRIGAIVYGCVAVGTLALGVGFLTGASAAMAAALGLLGSGFALFLMATGASLLRSPSRHATIFGLGAAVAALLITTTLGLYLVSGHAGLTAVARHLTDLHWWWGAAGWIAVLVAAVAYQVVPMFQITPDYPRWLQRGFAPAMVTLLVVASACWWLQPAWLPWIGGVIAAALAPFAVITLRLQQQRRRRLPDVTVAFWRLAMVALLGVSVIGTAAPLLASPLPVLLLGVLFLFGFALSVMSGMLYKIVPFLIWLHLNNRIFAQPALRGRVPNMRQVIPELRARRHFRLHLVALVLLCGAAISGETPARVAGGAVAVVGLVFAFNMIAALRLYVRLVRTPDAAT